MPTTNTTVRPRPPVRTSRKGRATHDALIEIACEMFSTDGYRQTSIRDIAKAAGVTTGAIYGHFRNKADLLAEAISARTVVDHEALSMDQPPPPEGIPAHVDTLRRASMRYADRRQLRALILQGAAASLTDLEARERLRDEQLAHIQLWIDRYEENRDALGVDPAVDIPDAILYSWAAEVGLGILEAIGIVPRSRKSWGDMGARFARSLMLPPLPDAKTGPTRRRKA